MTTTTKDPVAAAKQLAKKLTAREVAGAVAKRDKATEVLGRIDQLKTDMLPIEAAMLLKVDEFRRVVRRNADRLGSADMLRDYASFSVVPFTWRTDDGYPKLAVYNINSPNMELGVVASRYHGYGPLRYKQVLKPELPRIIAECYSDVFETIRAEAKVERKSIRLSATFDALIPADVRTKIVEARRVFKEVFVVAEAPVWNVKKTTAPRVRRSKDPLVVGYDGSNLWLVASFDVTPLERYIEDEWCLEAPKE